jgi:hypothetical protein
MPTQDILDRSEQLQLEDALRGLYPNGHPDFIPMMVKKIELHSKKNKDYTAGDGANPLGNFHRVSKIKQLYPNADWSTPLGTALDYMLKQLDAGLTLWSNKKQSGTGEGVEARLGDVSIYSDIAQILYKEENKSNG